MTVLVTYASKHGATQGIAERIAHDLSRAGVPTDIQPVTTTGDIAGYDAFVIGSAAYAAHWMKEAKTFVHDHQKVLAERPDGRGRQHRRHPGSARRARLGR